MSIFHNEPWIQLHDFGREMDRLMQARKQQQVAAASVWTPAVDIHEAEDHYRLTMDIPGVVPEEIEVSMEDGVLEISGERKVVDAENEKRDYSRRERFQGAFRRSFKLPEMADDTEISAATNHGVLEVVIRKRAALQPRRIPVTH